MNSNEMSAGWYTSEQVSGMTGVSLTDLDYLDKKGVFGERWYSEGSLGNIRVYHSTKIESIKAIVGKGWSIDEIAHYGIYGPGNMYIKPDNLLKEGVTISLAAHRMGLKMVDLETLNIQPIGTFGKHAVLPISELIRLKPEIEALANSRREGANVYIEKLVEDLNREAYASGDKRRAYIAVHNVRAIIRETELFPYTKTQPATVRSTRVKGWEADRFTQICRAGWDMLEIMEYGERTLTDPSIKPILWAGRTPGQVRLMETDFSGRTPIGVFGDEKVYSYKDIKAVKEAIDHVKKTAITLAAYAKQHGVSLEALEIIEPALKDPIIIHNKKYYSRYQLGVLRENLSRIAGKVQIGELIPIREAAIYLRLDEKGVKKLIKDGKLKGSGLIKPTAEMFIAEDSLSEILTNRKINKGPRAER